MNKIGIIYVVTVLAILAVISHNPHKFKRDMYIKDHETQEYYFVHLGEQNVTVKPVPAEEAKPFIINPK